MRGRIALLVVPMVLVASGQITQRISQIRLHPGSVVDAGSRKGIMADAYAYGSQAPATETGCPAYADLLDAQHSSADTGAFTFHIPEEKSSYLTVYCQSGYASRTETVNDNSRDHTRVQPDPITLFPMGASDESRTRIATIAIATELRRLHLHLSYYDQANPTAFAAARASSGFSTEDRDAITTFMTNSKYPPASKLDQDTWKPETDVRDPFVAYAAMAHDLNAARADLRYYAQADKKAYSSALLTNFSEQKRNAIETIRTRRDPFESLK